MSTTGSWLKGCGIGCLAMVVLNVIIIFGGINLVKRTFSGLEAVSDTQELLTDRFGGVEDYVPPADGVVPAGRIEVFLAVQTATFPVSDRIDASIDLIRELKDQQGKSLGRIIQIVRNAKTIGESASAFLGARNDALLEQGMGLGEFTYIYTIVYHSWLGHELLDIPGENDDGGLTTAERLHENLTGMLVAQRRALRETPDPDQELLDSLEREILEMRIDDQRVPWQDGLPDAMITALRPYRSRLEAVHAPMSFMLGIGAENDNGGFDFQFN